MDDKQFCPSVNFTPQGTTDGQIVAYQCARPYGHDDRPHRNDVASDAVSWTDEEAAQSRDWVFAQLGAAKWTKKT